MYEELIKRVRQVAEEVCDNYDVDPYIAEQRFFVIEEAANAIEELQKKYEAEYELRVKAFDRLCEWCAVCPLDKRDAATCELANISEPQEEEEGE